MALWCIRGMRLLETVLILAAVLLVGLPAGAKGPTSATITGPGVADEVILTGDEDPEVLRRLMDLTNLWVATHRPSVGVPNGSPGEPIVIEWSQMGPGADSVVRQEIYLHATEGPLIHTPSQTQLSGWGASVLGWFEAPGELTTLLPRAGVNTTNRHRRLDGFSRWLV